MRQLELVDSVVVTASQSASYMLPLLVDGLLRGIVAVAVAGSGAFSPEQYAQVPSFFVHSQSWQVRTPALIIWGERDTSLGLSAANNLKHLPNSRLVKLPDAGHACYLDNPSLFQFVLPSRDSISSPHFSVVIASISSIF
jgi:abhydrolase domain-containing protein 14